MFDRDIFADRSGIDHRIDDLKPGGDRIACAFERQAISAVSDLFLSRGGPAGQGQCGL